MIGAAVRGLDDLPRLVPVVQQLGLRHQAYGVQPAHYDSVGSALMWAPNRNSSSPRTTT